MAKIYALQAREIFDGRGWPTVELLLWLDNGFSTITSVPTTVAKGAADALELRDNDQQRMLGHGVMHAVENINTIIAPQLVGKDVLKQRDIDQILLQLDPSPNKSKLGANATLAVSQAVLKAGALSVGLPLYEYIQKKYQLVNEVLIPNCIITALDGGIYGGRNLDFREFLIIPASNIALPQSLEMAFILKEKIEELLVSKGAIHSVGLNGGFSPNLYKNVDAFELLIEAIRTTPFGFAQDIFFGLNASAGDMYEASKYRLRDNNQGSTPQDLLAFYRRIRENYKLIYLEDPFVQDDNKHWQDLTHDLGETTTIAACQHLSSRAKEITEGAQEKRFNAAVIKPSKVGTISETMESIKASKDAGLTLILSQGSGETLDSFIVDLAVGVGANYVKLGPLNRGERIAKYNRLMEIYRNTQNG